MLIILTRILPHTLSALMIFLKLALSVIGVYSLSILTASAQGTQTEDSYELIIRPSICVSYDSDEPCTMTLNISWRGGNGTEVCLNTAMEEITITCWNNEYSGTIEVPYANTSNVVYQLISMQNRQVLAQAEVHVISRDLRDSRRRRRHVWSIL